jgi:hypothetical protein
MANETHLNATVTDAVSQSNLSALGTAPAVAVGLLQQVGAHAVGLQVQNAVARQQNTSVLADAIVGKAVVLLNSDTSERSDHGG